MINGLHGLVAEFGIYIPRGLAHVIGFAEEIIFDLDMDTRLPLQQMRMAV